MWPSLRPVGASAGKAAALPDKQTRVDPETAEAVRTSRHNAKAPVPELEQLPLDERIRERDPELAGEMVVTGPGPLDGPRRLELAQAADWTGRRDTGERLERIGDLGASEAEEAIAASLLDDHDPGLTEPAQVRARTGPRPPRAPGEIAGRDGVAAEQSEEHRGTSFIGEHRADDGKSASAVILGR
jgi:hypothetical protein